MVAKLTENIQSIIKDKIGDHVKTLKLEGDTFFGTFATGADCTETIDFTITANADDRTLMLKGIGFRAAQPKNASLFIMDKFSEENASLAGTALRTTASGRLRVELLHQTSSNKDEFLVEVDVLEGLIERLLVATTYSNALCLWTSCVDSGLAEPYARATARSTFEQYLDLFDQYGIGGFFSEDS